MKDYNRATKRDRSDDIDDRKHVKITKKAIDDIIVGLNNIAAKYGYGKGAEPFTNDEWNTIFRAKGIIKHLTAENQRLKEEAAEQKSIAEHEHATQMDWEDCSADCLTSEEEAAYGKGKTLRGLHITAAKFYDEPIELSEFKKLCPIKNSDCAKCEFYSDYSGSCTNWVTRPPQSWQFVEPLDK